jgi:hypothetical protein
MQSNCQQRFIGVHMYATFDISSNADIVDDEPQMSKQRASHTHMILSINDGKSDYQFGPDLGNLEEETIREISELLFADEVVLVATDVIWHALDLRRLFTDVFTSGAGYYVDMCDVVPFRVYKIYVDEPKHRRRSMEIARQYAQRKLFSSKQKPKPKKTRLAASFKLQIRYAEALTLFRLRWLEVQGTSKHLTGYELGIIHDPTMENPQDPNTPYTDTAFWINQGNWDTHIMEGTQVWLLDDGDEGEDIRVDVCNVKNKVVTLSLPGHYTTKRLAEFKIVRGGEKMQTIIDHLAIGRSLMEKPKVYMGPIQVIADRIGMAVASVQQLQRHRTEEIKRVQSEPWFRSRKITRASRRQLTRRYNNLLKATKATPGDNQHRDSVNTQSSPQLPKASTETLADDQIRCSASNRSLSTRAAKRTRHLEKYLEVPDPTNVKAHGAYLSKCLHHSAFPISNDLKSERYLQVNSAQKKCVFSPGDITVCEGYPGAGKTKTLAAGVLHRFHQILQNNSGWILCVAHSNAAALNIMSHISTYKSLRPFLKHRFSKVYAAFHPSLFVPSQPYRITPNLNIQPHGILVSTIGSLSGMVQKYPSFPGMVTDLYTDESGLTWDLDAVPFLVTLRNVTRWCLFGDIYQLPPYVTKMVHISFNSIMKVIISQANKTQDRGDSASTSSQIIRSASNASRSPITRSDSASISSPTIHSSVSRQNGFEIHIVKLTIQYRMLPQICRIHAPIFYSYDITSARPPLSGSPSMRGAWILRTPKSNVRDTLSLVRYEVNEAMSIAHTIHTKIPTNPDGTPFGICILSPYTDTIHKMMRAATERKYDWLRISTITAIQGFETNAVILATSRPGPTDLTKNIPMINVATSRAKDILVILLTGKMALGTYQVPDSVERKLLPWGHFALHCKQLKRNDSVMASVVCEIKYKLQRMNPRSKDKANRKRSRYMDFAQLTLRDPECKKWPLSRSKRSQICKFLCLKKKFKQNLPDHFQLYMAMMSCDRSAFYDCVQKFADISSYAERNDRIRERLGVRRGAPVTNATKDEVFKLSRLQ